MFLRGNKIRKEYYDVGSDNVKTYEYQHGNIRIQNTEQGKKMTRNEHDMHILGIIMKHYILKEEATTKKLTHMHYMTTFI